MVALVKGGFEMQRDDIEMVQTMINGAIKKPEPFDSAPLENKIKGLEKLVEKLDATVKDLEKVKKTNK